MANQTMPAERSFLLLHGFANHRPPEHWMHWLAGELEAVGVPVVYPQLPNPDHPTYEEWGEALVANLGELAQLGTEERIVLCHSLSCLAWFRACGEGAIADELLPDRLILVAPPSRDRIPRDASGFGIFTPDAGALQDSVTEEVRFVGSESDEYNPQGVENTYADILDVPFDLMPGAGHISTDDGYGPWPEMLAWCLDPGGPIT
jgi:predicted alpha/beta hydrolase family esterase